MELLVVFLLFFACMALALVLDISMIFPLLAGFFLFLLAAYRRGYSLRQVLPETVKGLKDSFIVIRILLLIGCLTGLWRLSGTVACFVEAGLAYMPAGMFFPAAFLITAFMSYALGTSFGVTATAGVILMTVARAGGVNPTLAAGAILSGVYVGDRGSPASSSANLVAVLTHTDMRDNVRDMLKASLLPFGLCIVLYTGLALFFRSGEGSGLETLQLLQTEFSLHWVCLLPAAVMILLPFCRVKVKTAMVLSLLASVLTAMLVQHCSLTECVTAMAAGFTPTSPELSDMLSGGGILSMLEICGILLLSGTYEGIFRCTGMLDPVRALLDRAAGRIGRFPVMLGLGTALCAVFCNQTISAIMQSQLTEQMYGPAEERCRMLDMEDSVILVSGLVPWCIASSVPLSMLGAGAAALPVSFYLWLVPLYHLLRQRKGN